MAPVSYTHLDVYKRQPLARYLAGPNVRRECPAAAELAAAFRIEVARRQRRSDGTVSLAGARFEVPARYRHLTVVPVSYTHLDVYKRQA